MDWDTPVMLFVMNLAPTLPDTFILRILRQCGNVLRWRRAMGVKDNPCDFGFVDFGSPGDALRALRIIPQITILDLSWVAKIDKNQQPDLVSFEQTRRMRIDYDEEKELKKDQLILHMVSELVASSAFARVVPRLTEILFSENDDSRVSEHYRYLNAVRRENDELEELFRRDLIAWRTAEHRLEIERREVRRFLETAQPERASRDEFLRQWRPPEPADEDFVARWKEFIRVRQERKLLRKQEEELEQLL
jgi:RNA recognition motif-containing protein